MQSINRYLQSNATIPKTIQESGRLPYGTVRKKKLLGLDAKRLEQVLSLIRQAVHIPGGSVIDKFECRQVGDNQRTGPGIANRSGSDTEVVFECFIAVNGLDQRTRYGKNLHYTIVQVIIIHVVFDC